MNCREAYKPNKEEIDEVIKLFNLREDQDFGYIHELENQAIEQEVGGDTKPGTNDSTITQLFHAKPNGCQECHETGYAGRMGIYE
ncbi:hypothetical protein, partial [Pseudomonas sp. AH2 (2023)]|uniref:hypothetical protein n=1 Tax=Pseudomonas sp. AH2 (2023) TaxID=3048599 RepID=UPI002B226500